MTFQSIVSVLVGLVIVGSTQAQPSPTFYKPLALALAPAEPAPGGGGEGKAAGSATEELAKKTQNPVSDLISVPFQNNFNFGIGPNRVTQWDLNVEPVIPMHLTCDWNLIARVIVPIINQPSPAPGIRSAFGLGDINPTFFLSPAKPHKLIWGLGPTFLLPTATDPLLGQEKWCAGPSVVALMMPGHWVIGALANNQWSFAGWGDRSVNQMLVQPFINYNMPEGWYLTSSPIITANWHATSDERWTVPVGGGVGRIFKMFDQHLNAQLQAFCNVKTPHDGPDWQLRAQIALLFPEKKK